jgi:hypothetical protein
MKSIIDSAEGFYGLVPLCYLLILSDYYSDNIDGYY